MLIYGFDGNVYEVNLLSENLDFIESNIVVVDKNKLKYIGPNTVVVYKVGHNFVDIDIKHGYEWDGASIPTLFQPLIGKPTDKKFRFSSLIHDIGYGLRTKRVVNDAIFYYNLKLYKVSEFKITLMFLGVRTGGHVYYASDTSGFWRFVKKLF